MYKRLVILAALLVAFAAPASATPFFYQNFNSENGGHAALNYAGFSNFTISGGTVDLIGNGNFEFPPVTDGHGLYVDLDGSTSSPGLMTAHPIALTPGNYTLAFQLAGNQRGAGSDTVETQLLFDGGAFIAAWFTVLDTDPFGSYWVSFGISTPVTLTFSFLNDGGDNVGALLDNVELTGTPDVPQVPEPASLVLLGTGLVGAVAARRKRRAQV